MAARFQFKSSFLCEKVLIESDRVLSAIRLVDTFGVPEDAPPDFAIMFYVVAMLKSRPAVNTEYQVVASMVRANGEKVQLPLSFPPAKSVVFENDPSIPAGPTIIFQMAVQPRGMGTCLLEIAFDGVIEIEIPFTLRRSPPILGSPQEM